MADKKKKKNSKYPARCHRCQFFNSQKDKCTKEKDKCNTDYSVCENFLIRESLVMY